MIYLPVKSISNSINLSRSVMTEQKLKSRIFFFMMVSKIITVILVLFHWQTGGYSLAEALATIALILPLFTVYLTAMVKDTLTNPYVDTKRKSKEIKGSIVVLTYLIFPLYTLAIFYLINLKPQPGPFSFENLQAALAGIETGFGIYIGQIVFALFKKEDSKN